MRAFTDLPPSKVVNFYIFVKLKVNYLSKLPLFLFPRKEKYAYQHCRNLAFVAFSDLAEALEAMDEVDRLYEKESDDL